MSSFERTIPPSPALRPLVQRIRVVTAQAPREELWSRWPEASAAVVFCRGWSGAGELLAVGPQVAAHHAPRVTAPLYVRLELRPGAARTLFGMPPGELGGVAPLSALWGARGVEGLEPETPEEAIAAMEALLARRVTQGVEERVAQIEALLRRIDGVPERVPRLARRAGVSERQLRRLFHDEIGLSPKRYARIARIRALLARAGSASWASLAAEHGFSDQAHLSNEFHALLGVPPMAFLTRGLPHARRCGG